MNRSTGLKDKDEMKGGKYLPQDWIAGFSESLI